MGMVLDEYVQINEISTWRTRNDPDLHQITYNSVRHRYIETICGSIYIDDEEQLFFHSVSNSQIKFTNSHPLLGKALMNFGNLDSSTGRITFYWYEPPPNHFLAVSYHFSELQDKLMNLKKSNWQKEGF